MRFNLNKKALLFEPLLILFVIITLSSALYNILINTGVIADLSHSSSNIIELDKEAKLKLELAEQAALYHTYNSIIQLGENSGFSENQLKECKSWNDFKFNEKCKLNKEKIKENLKIYIQKTFNEYSKQQELNLYSLDIKEENNKLIIKFNSPNIKLKKENVEFTINHEFTKEINYNLNIYNELYNKFHSKLLEKCPENELSMDEGLVIEGLKCDDKEKEFISFEYKKEIFYLSEKSFKYPNQPVIKFKVPKIIVQS